jgi:hypothetical protein
MREEEESANLKSWLATGEVLVGRSENISSTWQPCFILSTRTENYIEQVNFSETSSDLSKKNK